MRVLYLCHRIPYPPNKGEKIRAFHQLRAIGARHEVDLFTLADDARDLEYRSDLSRYCHQVTVARLHPRLARLRALPFLLTGEPLTVPYFYSAELDQEIRQALLRRSYDRIFIYSSAMAQYVEWVDEIPTVVDLVDVDSDKWTQYAALATFPFSALYRREGRCLRKYERSLCAKAACLMVTTEREADLVHQISSAAAVHVIPNGVDTNFFSPPAIRPDANVPSIVFTGDMSYFPNVEAVTYFARQVLPLIHRTVANARFLIVGRNPGSQVRRLQTIKGVEVTGFVPDVRTYLAQAVVAAAPFSIAAGIQNKILEAMAFGLPVVATLRAVRGLSPDVASVIETGDTPEELSAKTVRLIGDPQRACQIGIEGRRRVTADYNWADSLDRLLGLVEQPASKGSEMAAVGRNR